MGRKPHVASLQHWNTVVWLALAVAVILGHKSVWFLQPPSRSRFVNGFVITEQESRRRYSQGQPSRQHHGVCSNCEQKDLSFPPLHAKTKKRYGFEVRRAKREANRKRRRERAETMEASIHEINNDDDNEDEDDDKR